MSWLATTATDSSQPSLLRKELLEKILESAKQLSPILKDAVLLRDLVGLRYREVAEELGITEVAAKVRAHRARKQLQELLRDYSQDWSCD